MTREILAKFVDIDVTADAVTKEISKDYKILELLTTQIKALKPDTGFNPSPNAAVAMLGMQNVRNFICLLQIYFMFNGKYPDRDAQGKLAISASDYLKHAIKTEEFAQLKNLPFSDAAFVAGLLFDVLSETGTTKFGLQKSFQEYVAEIYKHGLRSAVIGLQIAKALKYDQALKLVFVGCLLHDLGKLALEIMYPPGSPKSYQDFRKEIAKKQYKRHVIHLLETKQYGLTHEYYSSQILSYSKIFKDIERAILFHHEPYLICSENRDIYQFASIVALATNMATNAKAPKDTNDPVYSLWLTPELKDLKITKKTLMIIMLKLGRETA